MALSLSHCQTQLIGYLGTGELNAAPHSGWCHEGGRWGRTYLGGSVKSALTDWIEVLYLWLLNLNRCGQQ